MIQETRPPVPATSFPEVPVSCTFRDVVLVPGRSVVKYAVQGGPVLPDLPELAFARHCRNGRAIGLQAEPEAPETTHDGPLAWGGAVVDHFGHLIGDQMGRVLLSRAAHPDVPLAFVLQPGLAGLPAFFHQVMDWLSVPRQGVVLIDRPTLAPVLYISPQAEQLARVGPRPGYLDLLDANRARQALPGRPDDLVYVTRAGMAGQHLAHHAGESYLAACLRARGVTVIAPETLPLREQLAHYAGARRLCFAEGSALHGRQLLGRIDQELAILCRRPKVELLRQMLEPRVRELRHEPVTAAVLPVLTRAAPFQRPAKELSLCDPQLLLEAFHRLGADLAPVWDSAAHAAARDADILRWAGHWLRQPAIDAPAMLAAMGERLVPLGIGHLLPALHALSPVPVAP